MEDRVNREEEEDPKTKTVRGKRQQWSVWREAIVPPYIGDVYERLYSPRTARPGIKTHYLRTKS